MSSIFLALVLAVVSALLWHIASNGSVERMYTSYRVPVLKFMLNLLAIVTFCLGVVIGSIELIKYINSIS